MQTFNEHCRDGDDGTFAVEDLRMVMMDYGACARACRIWLRGVTFGGGTGDSLSAPMMDEMLRMVKVDSDLEQVRYSDLVDVIVGKPPRSRLGRARAVASGATAPASGSRA